MQPSITPLPANILRIPLLFCLLIVFAQTSAEEILQGRTLNDYLDRAQQANPGLAGMVERQKAVESSIGLSSALPDPMLQVTHFGESVQTRLGPQENAYSLSQRFPWFGRRGRKTDAARAESRAQSFAADQASLSLQRRVALAYFEYAYIGKALELSAENLELLRQMIPIAEERVRGGGDLNPLLRLQVERGRLTDRLHVLERNRLVQSATLCEMLALPANTVLPWPIWPEAPPEPMDAADLESLLQEGNPELAMLREKINAGKKRQQLARLEKFPDLTLGVNYIAIGDSSMMPAPDGSGQDAWSVTVGINLPLWQGRIHAVQSEAEANLHVAELIFMDRQNALRSELQSSMVRYADAKRQVALYGDELLGLARQAVENTRSSYEGGRASVLDVIDSERSLLELQLLYWRALADACQQHTLIATTAPLPGKNP